MMVTLIIKKAGISLVSTSEKQIKIFTIRIQKTLNFMSLSMANVKS